MKGPEAYRELIDARGLLPHPEGGWYRETRRAIEQVTTPFGDRPRETAIEFLLAAGQVSRLHRLQQVPGWGPRRPIAGGWCPAFVVRVSISPIWSSPIATR